MSSSGLQRRVRDALKDDFSDFASSVIPPFLDSRKVPSIKHQIYKITQDTHTGEQKSNPTPKMPSFSSIHACRCRNLYLTRMKIWKFHQNLYERRKSFFIFSLKFHHHHHHQMNEQYNPSMWHVFGAFKLAICYVTHWKIYIKNWFSLHVWENVIELFASKPELYTLMNRHRQEDDETCISNGYHWSWFEKKRKRRTLSSNIATWW